MASNKELIVIVPVYNEAEVIEKVINEWLETLTSLKIDFEIWAYNDGSKDHTLSVLQSIQSPFLKVIDKPNSGHGPTILRGYKEAKEAEWLFQIDSDNEIVASNFAPLWAQRAEYDLLIGNRLNRNIPKIRTFISWASRILLYLFYRGKKMDVNCPFRLMRNELFQPLFQKLPAHTLTPNIIISGYTCLKRFKLYTMDVSFTFRQTGTVSIKKWKLFKFVIKSFRQTVLFRFISFK